MIPSNASLAATQISQMVERASRANLLYTVYSDPGDIAMQLVTAKEQVNATCMVCEQWVWIPALLVLESVAAQRTILVEFSGHIGYLAGSM